VRCLPSWRALLEKGKQSHPAVTATESAVIRKIQRQLATLRMMAISGGAMAAQAQFPH